MAVLKRVAEDRPRAIREIIPETPQWLCDIIAKLHAKNPDDRYQSAREVADVLADCEAQLKANAKLKDYSRIPRGKPRRSGRWKWAAAALVLVGPRRRRPLRTDPAGAELRRPGNRAAAIDCRGLGRSHGPARRLPVHRGERPVDHHGAG